MARNDQLDRGSLPWEKDNLGRQYDGGLKNSLVREKVNEEFFFSYTRTSGCQIKLCGKLKTKKGMKAFKMIQLSLRILSC